MASCLTTYVAAGKTYLVIATPQPSDFTQCQYVALTGNNFVNSNSKIEALQSSVYAPFDYAQAGLIFSFFFSFTVGLWWFAKNLGVIISAVRRF